MKNYDDIPGVDHDYSACNTAEEAGEQYRRNREAIDRFYAEEHRRSHRRFRAMRWAIVLTVVVVIALEVWRALA